ncbi:hypothetical protein CLAIMM_03369 [Cladophialophora immunda]|nr:hypothetical protein CLAIMM_03369 [Cladophialophora immunda]
MYNLCGIDMYMVLYPYRHTVPQPITPHKAGCQTLVELIRLDENPSARLTCRLLASPTFCSFTLSGALSQVPTSPTISSRHHRDIYNSIVLLTPNPRLLPFLHVKVRISTKFVSPESPSFIHKAVHYLVQPPSTDLSFFYLPGKL